MLPIERDLQAVGWMISICRALFPLLGNLQVCIIISVASRSKGTTLTGVVIMNKKQTIALWAGIAVFVFVGLNPRIKTVSYGTGKYIPAYVSGDPNSRKVEIRKAKLKIYRGPINTGRLFCYWTMIAVVTGGLIVTFKDNK
jgi:hypothetical protein